LGEVMGVLPCVLCWYQRIAMFPLVIILAVGQPAVLGRDPEGSCALWRRCLLYRCQSGAVWVCPRPSAIYCSLLPSRGHPVNRQKRIQK
jgi:hypothetical protein